MKIKYIIDTPYEGKFTITSVKDSHVSTITKTAAFNILKVNSSECFFSAKADVALRSVDQKEIFPGTNNALSELTVKA